MEILIQQQQQQEIIIGNHHGVAITGAGKRQKHPSMPSSMTDSASANANGENRFNVDYFRHPWDELDLKASWSVITKHKKTYVDGIRLENASWRKWMQKRLNLGKVEPETLRWKKEEDITWLYGPFIHNASPEGEKSLQKQISAPSGFDSAVKTASSSAGPPVKKSALKNRSIVHDLKKFQTKTNELFARTGLSSENINYPQETSQVKRRDISPVRSAHYRKLTHSKSDSDLISNPTKYLNVCEKSLLDKMNSHQRSPTSPKSLHFNNRRSDLSTDDSFSPPVVEVVSSVQQEGGGKKTSPKLRFSKEIEVLEYDDSLLDRVRLRNQFPPHIQRVYDSPTSPTSDTSSSFGSSETSSIVAPVLIGSTNSISDAPSVLYYEGLQENPSNSNLTAAAVASMKEMQQHDDKSFVLVSPLEGPGVGIHQDSSSSWVSSIYGFASDLVSRYYNNVNNNDK